LDCPTNDHLVAIAAQPFAAAEPRLIYPTAWAMPSSALAIPASVLPNDLVPDSHADHANVDW